MQTGVGRVLAFIAVALAISAAPALGASDSSNEKEKPLSLTIEDGRAMIKAVKKAKIVWQTGSQQRSDWNFRRVCELVRNGRIGELHTGTFIAIVIEHFDSGVL